MAGFIERVGSRIGRAFSNPRSAFLVDAVVPAVLSIMFAQGDLQINQPTLSVDFKEGVYPTNIWTTITLRTNEDSLHTLWAEFQFPDSVEITDQSSSNGIITAWVDTSQRKAITIHDLHHRDWTPYDSVSLTVVTRQRSPRHTTNLPTFWDAHIEQRHKAQEYESWVWTVTWGVVLVGLYGLQAFCRKKWSDNQIRENG